MPIHFEDQDVIPEVKGLNSVLIVPCNMCAAATVADREGRLIGKKGAKEMETGIRKVETGAQESIAVEILELYEKADETVRLDLYMTNRDLRERFDRIELL